MTNMNRLPFTDEIEQAAPPCKFSMPYFTSFKENGDPARHLKHYRSRMVLYPNNDALMCKIFATTLQGEMQNWFHTLQPRFIRSFDDLSLIFTKEYSFYRSINKKADHLFNIKKNPKESLPDYVKRFKAKKAKIVGELIMKEDLTLADSFILAEKHALWDKARRADNVPEQHRKESVVAQKKKERKLYNNKNR